MILAATLMVLRMTDWRKGDPGVQVDDMINVFEFLCRDAFPVNREFDSMTCLDIKLRDSWKVKWKEVFEAYNWIDIFFCYLLEKFLRENEPFGTIWMRYINTYYRE